MLDLNSIRDDVQDVAEAISLAIGCDVEAIDRTGTRIAGTGELRHTLGKPLQHGHVYKFAMETQTTIMVEHPGSHDLCRLCKLQGGCYYLYSVSSPIVVDGESMGMLAVISFDPDNAAQLRQRSQNLARFVQRMAGLVSAKLKEHRLMSSLGLATAELTAILHKLDKGLVAFDEAGELLHYNKAALKILDLGDIPNPNEKIKSVLAPILHGNRINAPEIIQFGKRSLLMHLEIVNVYDHDHIAQKIKLIDFLDYAMVKKNAGSVTIVDRPITFNDILTRNPTMEKLIEVAKRVARSSSTILLRGASGTGKEIFARAIHQWSERSGHFIAINCGAIPETLLESEFFGYDAGAFTGAKRGGKPGKFELADGGTIFLDELGTMPLHLQSKLLRVLEERRVDRLGGKQSFPINVRVISATNENLEERIKDGHFREDLYFRLNVIPLTIPPLRERPEDIDLLGNHYLHRYSKMLGKTIHSLSDDLREWMTHYSWPGNIRELSNVIEYAVNIEDGATLSVDSLPPRFESPAETFQMCNKDKQRMESLRGILQDQGWGKSGKIAAAKAFGVSLATIYRWVEAFDLKRPRR
jgi:transcriptional regulator with PAS, ATPase and Fis domain